MNYPNGMGRKPVHTTPRRNQFGNRGMTLEEDINITNKYYLNKNKAIIHKKPTPVQIVRVNYPRRSAAVITEGYFKEASTTDYNGIYKRKYIDFEAKETNSKTSFPLANIHEHQVQHMQSVVEHGGISFLIIRFTIYEETYLMKANVFFSYWSRQLDGGRKSIAYDEIKENGHLIPFQYQARVDYLKIIDKLFKLEE